MRHAPPDQGAERGNTETVQAPAVAPCPSFRIRSLYRIGPFGAKFAIGTVEVESVGAFDFEVFQSNAKPPFVAPATVPNKYTGTYDRTFRFAEDFRAALLEAVLQRLDGDGA